MINKNDIGFIHDLSNLDKLRKDAINGETAAQKEALTTAAKQFESIFTNMLFKSMRKAGDAFKSDLTDDRTREFYQQMQDEQTSTQLASSGSLGLADMIVKQLSAVHGFDDKKVEHQAEVVDKNSSESGLQRQYFGRVVHPEQTINSLATVSHKSAPQSAPVSFASPESFVKSLQPYAQKAASNLGIDSSILLAQAALETGWGKKIATKGAGDSSHNLFNIKADSRWKGDQVLAQTHEYDQNNKVAENAKFRSYSSYQESFDDFVNFIHENPRYKVALQQKGDSAAFIKNIHAAGYATDPHYSDKVLHAQKSVDKILAQ